MGRGVPDGDYRGKVLPGQVEPGVTWWGDRVGDATSQVGGSIHALSGGKVTWEEKEEY